MKTIFWSSLAALTLVGCANNDNAALEAQYAALMQAYLSSATATSTATLTVTDTAVVTATAASTSVTTISATTVN